MVATQRYRRVLLALTVVLVASVLLAVAVGAVWISPLTTLRLMAWKLGIAGHPDGVPRSSDVIVFQLRLPRVVLAAVVGAAALGAARDRARADESARHAGPADRGQTTRRPGPPRRSRRLSRAARASAAPPPGPNSPPI